MNRKFAIAVLLIAGTLLFSIEPNMRPLQANSMPDKKEIQALREENLRTDLISLQDRAAAKAEEKKGSGGPVIDGPLTLSDAIGHAIKYNLDAAVSKLEQDIQEEAVFGAKLKMLPSLKLEGEIGRADKYNASFSDPLFTDGAQAYNYSRDKSTRKFNLELSWDLLDFGIAYYQHRQAFNQLSILEQRRRRIIQNLKFDVTKTFWQVQVAKSAVHMAGRLIEDLQERERIFQEQIESQTASAIDVLETSVTLAEMKMKMSGFESELQRHKHSLATLMGLTEMVDFEVETVDFSAEIDRMATDIKALETEALSQRPEMFERDLEELINVDEARIAVTKMAPSPSVFYRFNYDHDSHLYYDHWHDIGFKLTLDMLSVPEKKSYKRQVQKKEKLIKKQRLALAAAIVTQLNIAVVDYEDAMRKYMQTKDIEDKRAQLMKARRRHLKLGNGNIEEILESEAKHFFSQVRSLAAYADAVIAKQRILNTVGRDETAAIHFVTEKTALPAPVIQTEAILLLEKSPFTVREKSLSERIRADFADTLMAEGYESPIDPQTSESNFRYSINLSSWRTMKKARKVVSDTEKKGLMAYYVRVDLGKKGIWWRCFAGCYRTREEAESKIDEFELVDAAVKKTPFANLIGCYSSDPEMQDISSKLAQMGYFPYAVRGENNTCRLLTGAFVTRKRAEDQNAALMAKGIRAEVVRR